ncbi:MAG: mannose-6-phosphate isomerase, class I [Desulfobacteraceae bacterium]|nr:mannose-6-phosphate isomerase, class I [Desulfobacteraceae bacterium]MDH3722988.1 mannose-6-phosphate isomerase, class I [Desulfobacteraceae bacterium]
MTGICLLKNTIQEYAWGSYTAIPELLGNDSPANTPQAELWMGAHPKAPSQVKCNGKWRSLLELIDKNSRDILGEKVAQKFKNRLPYLFKVLAAAKPLSIQAHPSLGQAGEGFERENRLKIPLDAPNRNYKDDNHKPECICALTFFWALNGFRKIPDMISLMDKICPKGLKKDFDLFRQQPNSRGLKEFFKAMMIMDRKTQKQIIDDAVKNADQLKDKNNAYQWIIDLHKEYPSDIGIFSPIILNLICLEPGQAMFLPAGTLHAYLDGVGIELMANSDNVLRGGLTPKHVDVKELLNVLNFEEREINILNMERINPCEHRYESHAEEFALSVITVKTDQNYYSPDKRCVEMLLCTDGDAVVVDLAENKSVDIKKGMSILIPDVVKKYSIKGDAVLYKAAVPI